MGDTLSANQGDIADSDGLPATFPDDYAFQWMREDEDGMNGEDISGEMSSTYTLTADDVGRKVRVRVSFTDQLSGMETVTSDPFPATGTVIPIPPTVTLSGPSPAVEEGNDLAFTLTLDVAAPADLTVNLTVAETEDVVAGTDVGSRTVTVMEGQTQAMFTVATENDDVDEADSVVTVTVTADSDDPATYEVGSPSQATVTVTDDDERGVTVMPPQLTMNENSTGAYTVVLTSRPTDDVTITPSSDNSDVTFTPATLTFTAANWSTAQTVMVTAAQDADSTDDSATISHVVTGGADYGANNVTAASVAVTVSEVVVTIAAVPSPVSEGTAAVFTLMRTGIATDALAVDVMVTETGDVFAGTAPTEVTLGANLSTATLSVATRNDDVDEADSVVTVTVVADSDTPATYNVGSPSQATVTITDDDERGVTVSGSPVRVNEGGTGTYTVVLTSRPTGEVTITPSSNNDDVSVSPTTLTFTTSNWETTQTVTVTTVEDENTMDDTATITHTVTGADYQGITVDSLTVTVSEAVLPSVTIAAGLSPVTEGTAVTFTLTRTDPTTEELVVGVSVTENGEVISGSAPTYVTFDADSTTATLSVSTDDDNVDEDAGTVTVTVAMDSANPATYRLGDSVSASMTVDDNESSPVVTLLLSPDTIAKADGMSEIQAMLSGPSAVETRVTVSISADVLDAVELDPDPPVLVIPPGTTASSNAVTLTPVDNDVEASEDLSVTVSGMGSNTVGVTGPEPVTLTITDDDDTTAPTVTITNVPPTSRAPFTATITFSEVVSGFMVDDVTAGNATLSAFTESTTTPGRVWTVLVTPTETGEVMLNIAANLATDAANNGNTAAAQATSAYTAPVQEGPPNRIADTDTTTPRVTSITWQSPATSPTNADRLTWRVTFSEAVANVDHLDFTVSGSTATVSNVEQVNREENIYDVTVSGGDLASFNGTVTLGFTGGQDITDEAGNPLATTTPTGTNNNSYMVDNAAPTVEVTDVPETSTAPFTATITFNEPVSGFTVDDVTAVNATLSDFSEATTGTIWTVLVTPAADGLVTLEIGADVATDAVGNGNMAALQARSTYSAPDTAAPTVTITDVPETSTAPFTATITFNEVVSGFTVDDITVANATLSDFSEATTGMVWTVLVTPAADGLVTLEIGADVATDAAGNGNTAALQARSTYSAPAMDTEAQQEAKAVLDEVILPDVVQQLTAETTEVITSRLNTIASGLPSTPLTLSLDEVVADTVAAFHGERERLKNGSLDWRQALSGREFVLPLSSLNFAQGESAGAMFGENPFSTLALWGGGNYSTYRNIIENTDIDGNGFSAVVGMDLQPIPRLTTGLALTTSRWGLDYATDDVAKGTYEIGVTMVNPYVNWLATEQLSLWATVGYGRGAVEQDPDGDAATNRTDGLTSWAGGVRFEVVPGGDPLTGEGSPFGLVLKADGATSSFLDAQVQLARLAAEVSRSFAVENGLLRAALDLGWRIRSVSDTDDQDGQQQAVTEQNDGGGAELAGRLHWLSTDGSLSATVDTRVLLGGGHHREWGIGGHLRLTPSRRDGEGMSLTLQPSFGVTGTKLDKLWSLSGNSDLAIHNNQPNARLDAQLAYGFPLGNNALLTPYTELTWEETTNAYGAGLRYHLNPSLELDLKGARHHRANGNNENRLFLELRSHP